MVDIENLKDKFLKDILKNLKSIQKALDENESTFKSWLAYDAQEGKGVKSETVKNHRNKKATLYKKLGTILKK